MPDRGYIAGLQRGAAIAKELAAMGRNCGQQDGGPAALDAAAAAINAEADQEPTPAAGTKMCACCGSPIPA